MTDSEQSSRRPGSGQPRQRTVSTLRPQFTRQSTTRPSPTREGSYSLAGPRTRHGMPRQPGRHEAYVADGYRELNPEYERGADNPVFSLSGNLPHTVRGFMRREPETGKRRPVGVEGEGKGETETPPQLQNIDDRTHSHEEGESGANDGSTEQSGNHPGLQIRTASARNKDGQNLGTIGEEVTMDPAADSGDDEKTLTPEEPKDEKPFNFWAGFRRRHQDPLAEWLGTTILIAIGISSNLQVTTSQDQNGTAQTMYWAWGFATMIGIYVSGGSSGAHLNPALTIMLCVWRGFPARRVPVFVLAQLVGAFTGGCIAIALYRDAILHLDGALIPSSTGTAIYTQPHEWVQPATAFFTEAFGTGLLAGGIIALGDDANSPPGAGMHAFIIGLLVSCLLMAFQANTGACFNPVRDLGPRLAAIAFGYPTSIFNDANVWWIWGPWAATIIGALLCVGVYDLCIFKGGESPVNYSTQKWRAEGKKAEASWLDMFGEKRQARKAKDVEHELEKGEA